MKNMIRGVVAGSGLFVMAALPQAVMAAEMTVAGVDVVNTATINYQVNSTAQPQQSSNTATFKVDRKVVFTLVQENSQVQVAPGQTGAALKYTLTNLSNADLDFVLSAAEVASAINMGSPMGTDNQNSAGTFTFFLDDGTGAAPGAQISGTGNNRVLNLQRDDDTGSGDNAIVIWVKADIPTVANGAANNNVIGVLLTATAYEADGLGTATGAILADHSGVADVAGTVQNVFAEAASDGSDAAHNGTYSAWGSYIIRTVELVLTKSSKVIWDPINGLGNGTTIYPKAIPGAVVEYCLLVTNPGVLKASSLVIEDNLPAKTTYFAGNTGATPDLQALGKNAVTTGADTTCGDGTPHVTSYGSYDGTPTGPAPKGKVTADFGALELDRTEGTPIPVPGTPLWVRFHVTVD